MVSFNSRNSPRTSTVIFFARSPFATAVVTAAILRTCEVRLDAMRFTLSVKSFHVPATPGTTAWPPSLPSVPTSRATRVTSDAKPPSCSTIVLMASLRCKNSPPTPTALFSRTLPDATATVPPTTLPPCAAGRADLVGPAADRARHGHALLELAFLADDATHAGDLAGAARADRQDLVERVRDLAVDAGEARRQPRAEVTGLVAEQRAEQRIRER